MMGLFVLPMGKTWQENVEEAKANLRLLDRHPDCDHLIGFAIGCLEEAQKKLATSAVPSDNLGGQG